MELEIRDLQSLVTHRVSEKGVIVGRQGGGADVVVPERTISSKHCRLYAKEGKWFVEDLRSSNGTFVNGARISTPTPLAVGAKLSLCRYGFEVVRVLGASDGSATAMLENAALVDTHEQSTEVGSGTAPHTQKGASERSHPGRAPMESELPSQPSPQPEKTPPRGVMAPEPSVPRIRPSGQYKIPMGENPQPPEPTVPAGGRAPTDRGSIGEPAGRPVGRILATVRKAAVRCWVAMPVPVRDLVGALKKSIVESRRRSLILALAIGAVLCVVAVWGLVAALSTGGGQSRSISSASASKLATAEVGPGPAPLGAAPIPAPTVSPSPSGPSMDGSAPLTATPPKNSATPYQEFVRKRDAVETAIDADPTLLKQKSVLPLYQELRKITAKVKSRCGKAKSGKKGAAKENDKRISEKLCDADIFEQTGSLVDQLYRVTAEQH